MKVKLIQQQLDKHREEYHSLIAPIEGELLKAIQGELSTLLPQWGVQLYAGIDRDPHSDTYTVVFPGADCKPHYREYDIWYGNIIEYLVPYDLWEALMSFSPVGHGTCTTNHDGVRYINLLPYIGDTLPPPSDLYWLEECTTTGLIPWIPDLYWDDCAYRAIYYKGASFTPGTAYYGPINQYLLNEVLTKVLPVTTLPRYVAREKQVITSGGIELTTDYYQ